MAARGRSDEDKTAKVKEKVGWRHGIVVHFSRATWKHCGHSRNLQRNGVLGYYAIQSSMNHSSLL